MIPCNKEGMITMKEVYPVFFTKTSDIILIDVPDFKILTEGHDMADAISMARDAIELSCVSKEDRGEPIPGSSKINELDVTNSTFFGEGETIISYVNVDPAEYRKKLDAMGNTKSTSQRQPVSA